MDKYLLAVDGGTGSIRSVLFDLSGNQIGFASREWKHVEDTRYKGSMNFDCAANYELLKDTVKEVLSQTRVNPNDIISCASTSMREGIVLYDASGAELFACANVDSRASKELKELKTLAPRVEEEIYAVSGQTFSLGALARLLWVKNNAPEIYAKTESMNMLNDWLTYKLMGKIVSEPSNACTTGMFDLKKRSWSGEISKRCGLKDTIFPKVYECGEVIGNISESFAAQTGLSPSTLVVSGGGDAQLGALGVGCVNDGECAVFGGSFWQFERNAANPVFDEQCRIRLNCHAVPEMWQYEAIAFFPGLMMKWYKNAFCELEAKEQEDVYAAMEAKAREVPPGCYGMVCAFSDIMNYISWRHAAPTFTDFAFDEAKFNRYTFYRAIMESAAFVTRGHMELIREVAGKAPLKVTFAGGASKSPLWCQILSDVLNVRVCVPRVREATALGAAVLAGIGAGVYKNADEAVKTVTAIEQTYTPQNSAAYNEPYEKWRGVYKAQLALADSGVTRYMWSI